MIQQVQGDCRKSAPGVVCAAKGLGTADSGVSKRVPRAAGKLLPGVCLRAVHVSPARKLAHLKTPLLPGIRAGSRSPFNGRRQGTGEVLPVAREIGGKSVVRSVLLGTTSLNNVLKIFL